MSGILDFLSKYMNAIINILGVIVTLFLIGNGVKLSAHKSRVEDAINRKNSKAMINRRTMEIDERQERESVTPETVRNYEKDFNATCSSYNVISQFIPVFPLLGILGTVAGLMLQVSAGDFDTMIGSLGLALGSTFWGLIWAIILKVVVALFPARIINDVEIMLEDYDKKFSNAIAQRNIAEYDTKTPGKKKEKVREEVTRAVQRTDAAAISQSTTVPMQELDSDND